MLISTLNCEMWPNFSYRGVRSVQLLLLLLLLMVFSSENFGFSPPYAGIAGIGPALSQILPPRNFRLVELTYIFNALKKGKQLQKYFLFSTFKENLNNSIPSSTVGTMNIRRRKLFQLTALGAVLYSMFRYKSSHKFQRLLQEVFSANDFKMIYFINFRTFIILFCKTCNLKQGQLKTKLLHIRDVVSSNNPPPSPAPTKL